MTVVAVVITFLITSSLGMYFNLENSGQCFAKDVPQDTVLLGEYYLPGNTVPGKVHMHVMSGASLGSIGTSGRPMFDKILDGENGRVVFTTELPGVHTICFVPEQQEQSGPQKMYFRLHAGEVSLRGQKRFE